MHNLPLVAYNFSSYQKLNFYIIFFTYFTIQAWRNEILPTKTATRRKSTEKTFKTDDGTTNGTGKTASKNSKQAKDGVTDTVNRKEAQVEYKERRKSQADSIKNTDPELLREMLYQMVFGRVFEQKCAEVYRIGKIGGFCHLYIGQEAVGIGSIMALRPEDYVITAYRDHVQAIVKGITPESVMAELYGRAGGTVGGKGGSMHMFSKEKRFFGGHGIVGGQIGVGTGMAYAQKYKETDNVTLCFFGEAAVNQGIFHESLNMAQLWKLPIIYICENNQYGMGTSQKRAMSISNIASKGVSYGIANEFVDGMDVLAVRDATLRAIERARKESLPTLLEIRCYRFMGHSMSDPGKYRTSDEIKKYQERDPIVLFKESLMEAKIISAEDYAKIETKAKEATEKALKFADESPLPDEKELFTDVYA